MLRSILIVFALCAATRGSAQCQHPPSKAVSISAGSSQVISFTGADSVAITVSVDDGSSVAVATKTSLYDTSHFLAASSTSDFTGCFTVPQVTLLTCPASLVVVIMCNNIISDCPVHYSVNGASLASALTRVECGLSTSAASPGASSVIAVVLLATVMAAAL